MSTAIGQAAATELQKVGVSIPAEAIEAVGALLVDIFSNAGWKKVAQAEADGAARIVTVEDANKELAR